MKKKILITYKNHFIGKFIFDMLKDEYLVVDEEPDYRNFDETKLFIDKCFPEVIILNIPFCGGIKMNIEQPADLILNNIIPQTNVIRSAFECNVPQLLFIGSSCMYPKIFSRPMKEDDILTGPFEETNLAYSISKISGWQLCAAIRKQYKYQYQTLIPANLFGEYDDFNPQNAHVVGSLMMKFHDAKISGAEKVDVWGTGEPVRDFLYAADLANAVKQFIGNNYDFDYLNIGSGSGYSIRDIAKTMKKVVGFEGKIVFDPSKPDGMKVKVLDNSKAISFEWEPLFALETGLQKTYEWFVNNI